MIVEPVPVEHVYHISDQEKVHLLKNHFKMFYQYSTEVQTNGKASYETVDGLDRYSSGNSFIFMNAVMGSPNDQDYESAIKDQIEFFKQQQLPFVWYLDKDSNPEFKEALLKEGFQPAGVFRGVIGELEKEYETGELGEDVTLEIVQDDASLDEFANLVIQTFQIPEDSIEAYKLIWKTAQQNKEHPMVHFIARKQGKVVSAVSTLIEGDLVSFWNGASLPELRRQGLSSALRRFALKDAVSRGCRYGSSYLMAEGMAYGICTKLGYETKWKFDVFIAPSNKGN